MKKNILIGFLCGILFSIGIYAAYFFFSYAPRQHDYALTRYNQNVPLYKTFLECKKCKDNGGSPYDCALEVMSRNNLNRFTDFEKYQKSQEELYSNIARILKDKCLTKSIAELKTDPYLLGSRTSSACESYTIGLNLSYGSEAQCENDVKEYCKNPETSVKIFTQSEFVDAICAESAVLSDYRRAEFLKRGEIPSAPKLQDEYKKISDISTVRAVAKEISVRLAYSWGVVIPYWIVLFAMFVFSPFVGLLVGVFIGRKKAKIIS